jgi:uncharacterized membrane protein
MEMHAAAAAAASAPHLDEHWRQALAAQLLEYAQEVDLNSRHQLAIGLQQQQQQQQGHT